MKRTKIAVFLDFINDLDADLKNFPERAVHKQAIQVRYKHYQIVIAEMALIIADQIDSIEDIIKLRAAFPQKYKFLHLPFRREQQFEIKNPDTSFEEKRGTIIKSPHSSEAVYYTAAITGLMHRLFDARAKAFESPLYKSWLIMPSTRDEDYESRKKTFSTLHCAHNPNLDPNFTINFLDKYQQIQADLIQLQQLNKKYANNSTALKELSLNIKLPTPENKTQQSTKKIVQAEKKSLIATSPDKTIILAIRQRIEFEHLFLAFELILNRWCKILKPYPDTTKAWEIEVLAKFKGVINQRLQELISHICISKDRNRIQQLLKDTFQEFAINQDEDEKEKKSSTSEIWKEFLEPKVCKALVGFKDPTNWLTQEYISAQVYPKLLEEQRTTKITQLEAMRKLLIDTSVNQYSRIEGQLELLSPTQVHEVLIHVILQAITTGDFNKIFYCLGKVDTTPGFSEKELLDNYPEIALMHAAFKGNSDYISNLMRDSKLQHSLCKDYTLSVMDTKRDNEFEDLDETAMAQVSAHESRKLILIYQKNKKWWACGFNPLRKEVVCIHLEKFNGNTSSLPRISLISEIKIKLGIPNPLQIAWTIAQKKQHLAASVSLLSTEEHVRTPRSGNSSKTSSKTPSRATSRRSSISPKTSESIREREVGIGFLSSLPGSVEESKIERGTMHVSRSQNSSRAPSKPPSPQLSTRNLSVSKTGDSLREREVSPDGVSSIAGGFAETKMERRASLSLLEVPLNTEEKMEKIRAIGSETQITTLLLNIARQQDHKNFDRLINIVFANYPSLQEEKSKDFIFNNVVHGKVFREQWAVAHLALHLSTKNDSDYIAIQFLGQKLMQYLARSTVFSSPHITEDQLSKITKARQQFTFKDFESIFSNGQTLTAKELTALYGRHLKDFIASPGLLARLSISELKNARGDALHANNNVMYNILKAKRGIVSPVISQYWSNGTLSLAYSELMSKRSRLWRKHPQQPTIIKKKIAEEQENEEKRDNCFSCFK